jgi:hydrogenase expression/formation protein HypC
MCLGIPGRILELVGRPRMPLRMARVAFGEVVKEVSLALVPDAVPGEYVLVHAGTAIQVLNELAALEVLQTLEQMAELREGEA